nr:7-deoxyloganetic acid glucosyltransferase-like [Tanacetum cinerariifolium]
MARNTVKEITTNFRKLDKFEGHDFRRWQKKMHFLLTMLKVVYVLTTPMLELMEDSTVEAIRMRAKWENDDYICRGHILNGMSDSLFDVYTNVESAKGLWDSLESKILRQYTQHCLKMDESISVLSIIDKLPPSWKDFKHTLKLGNDDLYLVQLGSYLRIEESLRAQDSDRGKGKEVARPSVNMTEDGKNKNNKQNKGKKRDFKEHGSGSGSNKKPKLECWKCGKTGHFKRDFRSGNKNNANAGGSRKGSKDHSQDQYQNLVHVWNRFLKFSVSLISEAFYVPVDAIAWWWWIDSGATTHQNGVAERKNGALKEMVNSMLSYSGLSERFYAIEPNDLVSINLIIESRDTIFDENRFSSIPRPKDIIPNSDESQRDDHSDDVPSEIPEPCKGKRVRKAKSYGSDFLLYLVEGSRDQVGLQYSYCYSIGEDLKTYNEATQSQESAFWKEAIDDEIGFIMENNTWVLSDLPPGCKPLGCKWIFKMKMKLDGTINRTNQNQVDKTKKFLSSKFSMKDMGDADVILGVKIKREKKGILITQSHYIEKILKKFNREDSSPVSTPMDPVEKLNPNTGKPVDQLEYSRAIGCLMYAMTSTRPDIAYAVGRLSMFTSNPSRQHWQAITKSHNQHIMDQETLPPHVLIFPLPLQGPVNSMFKLAELLCLSGLHVTFLVTENIHTRLLKNSNMQSRFDTYPGFRLESISDGLPEDHPRSGSGLMEMFDSLKTKNKILLKQLLTSGKLNSDSRRPVTCIIADGIMGYTFDVANEVGLPIIYVRTISACCLWVFFCLPKLIESGELPFAGVLSACFLYV